MVVLNQIKLPLPVLEEEKQLKYSCGKTLGLNAEDIRKIRILKKSLDARKKPQLFYIYQVALELSNAKTEQRLLRRKKVQLYHPAGYKFPVVSNVMNLSEHDRPVIIGTGPAGLFCGYMLSIAGLRPILIERGKPIKERKAAVENFWKTGKLEPDCNVQFGEGGAGTFSDGKLQTQVKDKYGRIAEILDIFIKHGAPEEIRFLSKPHIGTDLLADIIINMRKHMLSLGAEFLFDTVFQKPVYQNNSLTAVEVLKGSEKKRIPCKYCILAIGHSARDTFLKLHACGADMVNKPFAVGFRLQHRQDFINRIQYGTGYEAKSLPPADYKLTYQEEGRNVYSFCMCPGGYVVNASSEENSLAINGMSYHDRASENANSAIVISVTQQDYGENLFDGMRFQQNLEKECYRLGNGRIPMQTYGDFCRKNHVYRNTEMDTDSKKTNAKDPGPGKAEADPKPYIQKYSDNKTQTESETLHPVMKGEYQSADLSGLLPEELNRVFINAMDYFNQVMPGFSNDGALLAAVESRTSSPVRILRNEEYESNLTGIFPCGEGAGYAGGITSAALDGIKVAENIALRYNSLCMSR